MKKIAIEIQDSKYKNLDLSKPNEGNIGIGGSEYLFCLLGYELSNMSNSYEVYFVHYEESVKLPEGAKVLLAKNYENAIDVCQRNGIDLFIHQISKNKSWYKHLSETELSTIAWAHVYLYYEEQVAIQDTKNVKCVVFVSKEQYDSYIAEDINKKSAWIYNMIDISSIKYTRSNMYNKSVTYIGSLVPVKGFHILAEVWPDILKKIPDAKLNVIGTGKLYDRNATLGKFGIAQTDYESMFMQYLTNESGKIIDSVKFYGILGKEKDKVLLNSAVGVVNPSGLTETFCLSAIEMEAIGIPVVTKRKFGLLDTVKNGKTGYLFLTKYKMKKIL